MSKRKAQNENLNSSDTVFGSQNNSQYLRDGGNIMSSSSSQNQSQFQNRTSYPEKRKKISSTFSDLSQMGDFTSPTQSSQFDSTQEASQVVKVKQLE